MDLPDALARIGEEGVDDEWIALRIYRPVREGEDVQMAPVYYRFVSAARVVFVETRSGEVRVVMRRDAQTQTQTSKVGSGISGMLEW